MEEIVLNNGGEYGKYILQEVHEPGHFTEAQSALYRSFATRIRYIDSNIMPGSFQMNSSWMFKPTPDDGPPEHTHDFPELLGFYSSDPNDPEELGAEVEFTIEGEKHLITKSALIFIPAGVKHLPMAVKNVRRPILHFGICLNPEYDASYMKEPDHW